MQEINVCFRVMLLMLWVTSYGFVCTCMCAYGHRLSSIFLSWDLWADSVLLQVKQQFEP